jgi:hypothetical protein
LDLLSFWWPQWRESLVSVPPGNRLALASYRLVGALEISITWSLAPWAPKVFGEVRHLIVWMARENFL